MEHGYDLRVKVVTDGEDQRVLVVNGDVIDSSPPSSGDLLVYENGEWTARPLADADIPAAIARDAEVTSAVGAEATARAAADALLIPQSIIDAKGDLIGASAADTPVRVPVGADGTSLAADSAASAGVSWKQRNRVLDEVHADTSISGVTADQQVFSLTIPAGIVAAGDLLRLEAFGDMLQNTGGNATYLWKLKLGTTTVLTSQANTIATSANRRKWRMFADIVIESTTAQRVMAEYLNSPAGTDTWIAGASGALMGYGTAAEDMANAKSLVFTVTLSSASSQDFVLHAASLALVKK